MIRGKSVVEDPFLRAVNQYRAEHRRDPESAEVLRPYAPSDAEFETFPKRFIRVEGMPALRRFRLDVHHRALADKYAQSGMQHGDPPTREEAAEIKRLISEGPQAVEVILRVALKPLLHPKALDLLLQETPSQIKPRVALPQRREGEPEKEEE